MIRRPLILTPSGHAIIRHYAEKLPVTKHELFQKMCEQRLRGEPSRIAIETVANLVYGEVARGEQLVVIGDRR